MQGLGGPALALDLSRDKEMKDKAPTERFGLRDVSGGGHKGLKLPICDRGDIHQEGLQRHLPDGPFPIRFPAILILAAH